MALFRESYAVLKSNPQMVLFPIISGVACLILSISFILPVALYFMQHPQGNQNPDPIWYIGSFCFYFVNYFIVIFFNSGLVACAHANLSGRQMTFKEGMAEAMKHLGQILVWAAISATVGMILRTISERAGILGKIVIAILGMAWNLITFFVVPVMIIENQSAPKSIKASGSLLRSTWGERVIGGLGMGMVTMALMLIGIIPIVVGVFLLISGAIAVGIMAFALAVLYLIGISIVISSLQGIFNTALYIYGRTGQVPSAFSQEYIQGAFLPKPERKKVFGM